MSIQAQLVCWHCGKEHPVILPHPPQFAFELAKVYNQFYAEVSIFSDSDPEAVRLRVALSAAVSETIRKALGLLGIEVPERM